MKKELQEAEDTLRARAYVAARAKELGMSVREYLRAHSLRQALRQRAEHLGLAYWPALYERGVNPRAFLVAEEVLAAKVGARWGERLPNGEMSHGGWDSFGVHGLSAHDVALMWRAAGCRDNAKFRHQVRTGVVARKGDSLPWFRAYARGKRWANSHRWVRWLPLSRKAIAALGRLSPEARWAALEGVEAHPGTIRTRDLNWAAVKRVQDKLRGATAPRVRAALLLREREYIPNNRIRQLLGWPQDLVAGLTPAFPRLPLELAVRVVLGESPVQLSGGLLTKREAHQWALDGAPEAISQWLSDYLNLPISHRSIKVVRWLAQCRDSGRWAALERERRVRMPDGAERTFTALSVLDEVQDEDILTGRDSVEDVLRRAAQRLGDAWLAQQMANHRILAPLPSWASKLPRWMRILRSPAALAREGKEMGHCVGGYAGTVERGECHILAIASRHGRSTVELRPDMRVAQHMGPRNTAPPARHEKLLRAFLARVKKGGAYVK